MLKKNYHVTRRENSWAVIREGAKRATGLFNSQSSAIDRAKPLAQKDKVELVIHDRHNKIRDKDSYGHDPCPPKDKKH